ncbi:hypothetical protein JCM18899A_37990 [Nocardioides sp. AN3]
MPVIDETVTIPAPVPTVFAYLVEGENLPAWDSSITECTRIAAGLHGDISVGTRYQGVSKIMGKRFPWTTEVVELTQDQSATSRSVEGSLTFTATYEVAAVAGGTQVRYLLRAESGLGGAFGKVMEPLVEKAQTKVVRANLQSLVASFTKAA